MPGVPSSRNCDACRKQKKKCDTDKPPCSRCTRLGIPCVNLGQKRWKFQTEYGSEDIGKYPAVSSKSKISTSGRAADRLTLLHVPQNHLSRLTASFIKGLDPSTDVRMQLVWNFGIFFHDIPRHLGANPALDAACETLVCVYDRFRRGQIQQDTNVIVKHNRALNSLRKCLGDSKTAQQTETLCAIMVLMMACAFTDWGEKQYVGHPTGVAQILKSRGCSSPLNDFENRLLLSLRGPVVFEGLMSGKVDLTRQEWHDLVENGLDASDIDGKIIRTLSRVPVLMQEGREALDNWPITEDEIFKLKIEAYSIREEFRPVLKSLRDRLDPNDISIEPQVEGSLKARMLHSHYTRMWCLGLFAGIVVNCVIHALEGDSSIYQEESARMARGIVEVARVSDKFRPLGSMYLTICLPVAWVAAGDPETKSAATSLMGHYQREFRVTDLTRLHERFTWIEDRLGLRESLPYEDAFPNLTT